MADRQFSPPPLAERLAGRALDEGERAVRLGDLEERFQYLVRERGERWARAWYRWQVLLLVILVFINHTIWSCFMFRNNLVIAWRNIKKSKLYSALNVLGLAVGMAVFILIMLYVRYELSYDRYHANAKNIYRIIQRAENKYLGSDLGAVTPAPLAPALVRDFPEILAAARIDDWSDVLIGVSEKFFLESKVYWADSQTFEIFSFPFIHGDGSTALKDPLSILLSERKARQFFGIKNPIGKTIALHDKNGMFNFRVSGVFRDFPANSHLMMDVVLPFESLSRVAAERNSYDWNSSNFHTYILVKRGTDGRTLENKLPAFVDKHVRGNQGRFLLQPLTRIHLTSGINFEPAPTGDIRFVRLFASIAVLVLVIACVNYMNLVTARSLRRAKEVGLRKVVGATKGQLIRQFLGDSMMVTFLALLLAVAGVLLALPAFGAFVEREIVFNPLRDKALMPALVLLASAVGAVAGSYPALFVSAFRPVSALKGAGTSKTRGKGLRNGLIVFQFVSSIALIICTVGVRSQLQYIRSKDMGYERDQILVLSAGGSGLQNNLEAFKTEIKRNPAVRNVSISSRLPNDIRGQTTANWPGKEASIQIPIYVLETDFDFVDLFGLKIVRGRNFSHAFPSDTAGAFLINESACKAIGWDDPIGRDFFHWGNREWTGKIVGVVKDFHMHSLHLPIVPLYIYLSPGYKRYISIKIRGADIPATLAFVREIWKRFEPEYPFEYSFFDEIFDRAYRVEQRLGKIFSAFSGLAVLIACLGLLGLASFAAEQRTREIGIRKVLGASTSGVIALLSREFMKWVVLANVIAWPIGYFAMRSWLRNFAYRTSLTIPMFLCAALAAFFIAAAVIGLRTYKAASANPADSIRYE